MSRRTKIGLGIAAAVLALGVGGAGLAYALTGEGQTVTGPAADRARNAAVSAVPRDKASEVDTDNAPAADDVKVPKPDGSTVTVVLDENDHVLGVQPAGQDDDGDDR
ncbi:MAG TPA: hypothetical protein VI248_09280 [Kineosporiaceae bacterium]